MIRSCYPGFCRPTWSMIEEPNFLRPLMADSDPLRTFRKKTPVLLRQTQVSFTTDNEDEKK